MRMLLSRKYCFRNEFEVERGLTDYLSRLDSHNLRRFRSAASEMFLVRHKLFELEQLNKSKKKGNSNKGLSDICITANERYLLPPLADQGIECCMEVRQYYYDKISENLPLIHAFTLVKLQGLEFIMDVNPDPFYGEDVGIIITPEREVEGLYSSGWNVHTRHLEENDRIKAFDFFTNDARLYFHGEDIPYLSIRNYFLDSDSNFCPIGLTPHTSFYFSYARCWRGMKPSDAIQLIMASNRIDEDLLLWNLTFYDLSYIELSFNSRKSLHLEFNDHTELTVPLDNHGYPLENDFIEYREKLKDRNVIVRYAFSSAPSAKIFHPVPF